MKKIEAAMKASKEDEKDTGEDEDVFPEIPDLAPKPGKLLLKAQKADSQERTRRLRKAASRLQAEADAYAALDKERCLAEGADDPTELPAPDTGRFGREPRPEYGAIEVQMERLGGGVVEESSGDRYCPAGQWKRVTAEDPRPKRYEVVLPSRSRPVDQNMQPTSESDVKLMKAVPQPETPTERRSADGQLASWQRGRAIGLLREKLSETDRLAVHAEPEQPHSIVKSFTVSALDREFVESFAKDLSELHYLKGMFSGGGYIPESDKPDYRRYQYMAVGPVECSEVMQALGAGPMVREVEGQEEADLERGGRLYKVIVDGRSPLLCPGEPEGHRGREFQFRAAIGHEMDRPRGYAKGMARPYGEDVLREALAWAKEVGAKNAQSVLEHVLDSGEPLLLLVKGDQIKVGADRVRVFGEALTCATHLRGTAEVQAVESPEGSYERAKPQYGQIRSNPQVTQLLTPAGFELIERHARIEAGIIAEKLKSVTGIAELVSESVKRQLDEVQEGTYHKGRDQLTDAVIGGGVRMKSADWEAALQGQEGTVQMLPSIQGRLDFNLSALIRSHLLTAIGIYGYGHHHAACENSTALCQSIWHDGPQLDDSAVAFPYKVSRLMNADDDGDIVVSLAANAKLKSGGRAKVVLTWRYPCVDVPVLWAFEEGTRTPFDGADEEERERFSRIIEAFGPEVKDEEPPISDDEVTLLSAGNAVRLSDQGAKEQVDKERASGPVNLSTSMDLVNKKRQLGRAGPLTRDLERCADLMALAMRKGQKAKEEGWGHIYNEAQEIYRAALEKAGVTSVRIEDNLTAFKYETIPTLEGVDFTIEKLANEQIGQAEVPLHDDEAVRRNMSLDYHDVVDSVTGVLPRHHGGRAGICLIGGRMAKEGDTEPWEGPDGPSRHARLVSRLCQEEIPKIAESLKAIETQKTPFRKILADRAREYASDNPGEKDRLLAEAHYVQQLCNHYRAFWTTVNDKEEEARSRVTRPDEEFERRISEWRSRAGRAIHEAMKAHSENLSPEGLAYGIARDWTPDNQGRSPSASAGMALMTGRVGELLLPAPTEVKEVRSDEQFRNVFRKGQDIPGAFQTETIEVDSVARLDTPQNQPDVRVEAGGEVFDLHVAGESPLPAGVASGDYKTSLTKTTRRGALLRWRRA